MSEQQYRLLSVGETKPQGYETYRARKWVVGENIGGYVCAITDPCRVPIESPWIAVAGRKPTEADGDGEGRVIMLHTDGEIANYAWDSLNYCTYWMPTPPTPPLPEPSYDELKRDQTIKGLMAKFDEARAALVAFVEGKQ